MFNAVSGLTPEVDIMKYCIGVPVQLKAKHLRCISKTGIKLEALLRAQLWVADFKSFYPMMLSIRRKLGNIRSSECRASICFRSEEHTSELQSLMRISYAVFCLKKKKNL